jgi:hypothetical protein
MCSLTFAHASALWNGDKTPKSAMPEITKRLVDAAEDQSAESIVWDSEMAADAVAASLKDALAE